MLRQKTTCTTCGYKGKEITIPDSEDEDQADIKPDLVKLNGVMNDPIDIIEISDLLVKVFQKIVE